MVSSITIEQWLKNKCRNVRLFVDADGAWWALSNRTPLQVIQGEGGEAEVERILDCIDYGMLA